MVGQLVGFGGTGDKHLVILHATGLLVKAYEPLAAALAQHYVVWGLDLPGHGTAAHCLAPFVQQPDNSSSSGRSSSRSSSGGGGGNTPVTALSLSCVVQYVIDAVRGAGLVGCYAFGHSAGGALALLAASDAPGLFAAIYCFEAVVAAPRSHVMLNAAAAAGRITTSGQRLTAAARRRRAAFASRSAAVQHLAGKMPLAGLHPRCLELYLQHGLAEVGAAAAPDDAAAAAAAAAATAVQQHDGEHRQDPQQQQQQQTVELVCRPELEAAYYAALDAPPAVQPAAVTCPVMLAVCALAATGPAGLAAARFASHAAVEAWALQQQQPSQELHAVLAVLNAELAALMPTARLAEVPGVSHFAPLEQPQRLAAGCMQFFATCCSAQPRKAQNGRAAAKL